MDQKELMNKIIISTGKRVEFLNQKGNIDDAMSIMDEFGEWITGDFSDVIFVSNGKIVKKN